jgi:heavy metal sensor kinase
MRPERLVLQPAAPAGRIRQRSLRQVLTGWYLSSLAVALCLFSGILYMTISTSLMNDLDQAVRLQTDLTSDTLFAFWRAERAAAMQGPGNWMGAPTETFRGTIDQGRLPELVARWTRKTGQPQSGDLIQLLARDGRPLLASSAFTDNDIPVNPAAIEKALQGHPTYETARLSDGRRVRIVTRPILDNGGILYLVQAAAWCAFMDRSLQRLRLWLLLLVPLTLIVTSAIGWALGTAAMRPIDRMITQARQIGVGRLHERIDVPQTRDPLERLAVTFNDLLGRLEAAFKRMRQFSAAASHELRTPLTAMKGELEVALRRPRDVEEYQRVLRTHLQTIDEMTATVEELLGLARSEAAEGAIEWRPVELVAATHRASEPWRSLVASKQIRVLVEAAGPVWVEGEQRLLERLVANLVDNAVRHTPAQGRVMLKVEAAGGRARLTVRDTGSGIPPEELPHIFDRFFKPRTPSHGASSTGLGLGLCRWIVEAHHGHIEVASHPGEGVTVTVSLPVTAQA